jgi:hypothetical protein
MAATLPVSMRFPGASGQRTRALAHHRPAVASNCCAGVSGLLWPHLLRGNRAGGQGSANCGTLHRDPIAGPVGIGAGGPAVQRSSGGVGGWFRAHAVVWPSHFSRRTATHSGLVSDRACSAGGRSATAAGRLLPLAANQSAPADRIVSCKDLPGLHLAPSWRRARVGGAATRYTKSLSLVPPPCLGYR